MERAWCVVDGSGDGVGSSEGVAEGAGVMGYEICGVGRGFAFA